MKKIASLVAVATLSMGSASAFANNCPVSHDDLEKALEAALLTSNGGFDLDMWASAVNRDGAVCAVVKRNGGGRVDGVDPWPASRVISAQKANTANSLASRYNTFGRAALLGTSSIDQSTGMPHSLAGLQFSNPVDPRVSYRGNSANYGEADDPMNGLKVGGVNIFGGGLALYNTAGEVVGAVGVSGDSSCADHNIAWRVRDALAVDVDVDVINGTDTVAKGATFDERLNTATYPACGGADDFGLADNAAGLK